MNSCKRAWNMDDCERPTFAIPIYLLNPPAHQSSCSPIRSFFLIRVLLSWPSVSLIQVTLLNSAPLFCFTISSLSSDLLFSSQLHLPSLCYLLSFISKTIKGRNFTGRYREIITMNRLKQITIRYMWEDCGWVWIQLLSTSKMPVGGVLNHLWVDLKAKFTSLSQMGDHTVMNVEQHIMESWFRVWRETDVWLILWMLNRNDWRLKLKVVLSRKAVVSEG